MSDDTEKAPPPLMTNPLIFSEGLDYYFKAGNDLYEAKVKGDKVSIALLQGFADALLRSLLEAADKVNEGQHMRQAVRDEQRAEKITLWLRLTANRLKAAKPGLLSLELLGSAGVVVAIAYYILQASVSLALLSGTVIVVLRLMLPWVLDRMAAHEERGMRKLRHIDLPKPTI